MSAPTRVRPGPWATSSSPGVSALEPLFWTWLHHESPEQRSIADRAIETVESGSGIRHDLADIETLLRTQKGTGLDPFRMSDASYRAAARFARIALGSKHRQRAVRFVSEATIGVAGGLVVDRDLNVDYYPRSILEGKRRTPWDLWYFAPSQLRGGASSDVTVEIGECGAHRGGLTILKAWSDALTGWRKPKEVQEAVRKSASIGPNKLRHLGLSVQINSSGQLYISAASPETMIRVAAALGDGHILRLEGINDGTRWMVATALPRPLPSKVKTLPVLVSCRRGDTVPGIRADLAVEVDPEFASAASRHMAIPHPWITDEVVELILSRAGDR
jgi:hypothetical protein